MTCIVSGRVVYPVTGGSVTPLPNKLVYIRPSRTDFEYSLDSGTTWQNWQGDPSLINSYAGAVAAKTNSTGDWAFTLPWTDSPTETRLPGGAPVPDLKWNVIDPNPATGTIVYYGALAQATVSSAKTIKDLITLASPNTWQVGSVTYTAVPVGQRRYVSITFTSVSGAAGFEMPNIGTASWRFTVGVETNDADKTYAPIVDSTAKTATSGTLRLSDVPPAGKFVTVHLEIYP